jgi:hypothetical protein
MPLYPFETQLVLDGDNPATVVFNTSITIYDPNDVNLVSPLALVDTRGLPLANPIPVNPQGFTPAFQASLPQVMWAGDGYTGYMSSYQGLLAEAQAAQAAATAAVTKTHYAIQTTGGGIPPRPTADASVLVFWICWSEPARVTSGTGGALPNDIWIQRAAP